MAANSQYSERVIEGMQMLYGEGFLSPGGAVEVDEMVEGETIAGRDVLDLGCGIGGAALALASRHGARRVLALDIEPDSLARARAAAEAKGLSERIETVLATPGPLPLPDRCVDIVFTKDVVCHIADKKALFAEAFRVLRPGGRLLLADFIPNEPDAPDPQGVALFESWVETLTQYGLSFHYEGPAVYVAALRSAGFADIAIGDHTAVSAEVARREHAFAAGPDAGPVREKLGEELFKVRVRLSELRTGALERRGLLHLHIRATRPGG